MTLLWFGKHGLPPVAALAELPKRQIFVSFKSVISPNPFPFKKGSIIFEMAVSQHAFSTDHRAQLCLGTDCHKLLHATCWLGLRSTYCMPQCQLLKKIPEEKCLQMCTNYPTFKVLYAHGKQEVTTWCT